MAASESTDPVQNPTSSTKSKKNKKKKSKAQKHANGDTQQMNGNTTHHDENEEEDEEDDDVPETPVKATATEAETAGSSSRIDERSAIGSDTSARLEAAARERDNLRVEVTEIRKTLEEIQRKHDDEKTDLNKQLEDARLSKDHADSRYQKLLGQVNTIKSTLHERLKADAEELAKSNSRIEELEDENKARTDQAESLQEELAKVRKELESQSEEITSVRGRTNQSQQNWARERDELLSREARAREEFESARQAMQDWEVLAMEERNLREGNEERVNELEEQLNNQREAFEQASSERESQNSTVDNLQRALQEVHAARKDERRELVETAQKQQEDLQKQLSAAESSLKAAQDDLEKTRAELEKAAPFEKEVREKNLLIGKLRQEAIILNDHLTKALRFLKRGKKDDQVDRQLVTNYLLHFLALDRTDPKKFQVLQLISSILGWSEEQQEQAGLARPGASTSSVLKVPLSSPFRRVSSSATLSPMSSPSTSGTPWSPSGGNEAAGRESLAELWSEFLEREAEASTPKASGPNVQSPPGSSAGASSTTGGK